MKVETKPVEPDTVICISWRQAEILLAICDGIGGTGEGRIFTDELSETLIQAGISEGAFESFDGAFR